MRIAVISSVIVLVAVITWVAGGRSISLLVDRIHRGRISVTPVSQLRWDSGTIEVAGMRLDTLTTETMPSGLSASMNASGQMTLTHSGRVFLCGLGRSAATLSGLPDLTSNPDAGDVVTFINEKGALSWPTPFEMNFMTGSVPSWKRHRYFRLNWEKRSGSRLEIVWRVEQGYFAEGGWRPQEINSVSAGLSRVSITD